MKSCNRVIVSVLVLVGVGCAGGPGDEPALATRDVGLVQSSGVPPLGEAVAPVSGRGGDGAAVVTQIGGWSGGPGAVKWHGGQWVMPYAVRPGSVLANVSCDVWNPTTTAPANVLVEVVSSNGQVLGSVTATASVSVVSRIWPFIGNHAITDGEQLIVKLSPKDATTGAWTSAAQDTTVISCALNAWDGSTLHISAHAFVGLGGMHVAYDQNATFAGTGIIAASVAVHGCASISGIRVYVRDSTGPSSQVAAVLASTSQSGAEVDIASSPTSNASGTWQTLAATATAQVTSGVSYWIGVKNVIGTGSVTVSGADLTCQ